MFTISKWVTKGQEIEAQDHMVGFMHTFITWLRSPVNEGNNKGVNTKTKSPDVEGVLLGWLVREESAQGKRRP